MVRIQSLSLLILGLIGFSHIYAQGPDCVSALVLCSDGSISFNPVGIGIDDFANPNNDAGCLSTDEQNSAWYYFEFSANMPPNSAVGFVIDPLGGSGEDYDFAVFGPNVDCDNLGEAIRCSYAADICTFCPQTGLGNGATDVSEGADGNGFVANISANPGEGYWLLVDNYGGSSSGFQLDWTGPAAPFLNCTVDPTCTMMVTIDEVLEVCPGGSSIPLAVTVSDNAGSISYEWTGDAAIIGFLDDINSPMPNLTVPAGFSGDLTYTLEATDDVCTETVPISIALSTANPPTITGDLVLCDGQEGILDGGDGYSTYAWSTGETTQTIAVTSTGTYSLTVTEGGNCVSDNSVSITEGDSPIVMLSSTFAHCAGETVDINASGDFVQLTWPDGTTGSSWTTGEVGDFTVSALSTTDCVEDIPFSIAESPTPEFVINTPEELTCNNNGINLGVLITSSGTNISYLWTGPDITTANERSDSPFINAAGEYTVVITDNTTNCVSIAQSVTVTEMREEPDATVSQSVPFDCASASVNLSIPVAPEGYSYDVVWSFNNEVVGNEVSIEVAEEGIYEVAVQNEQTGCSNMSTYELVYIDDAPEAAAFNLIPQRCSNDNDASIEIASVTGGQGPFTYSLNGDTPTTSPLFTNLAPGEYRVEIIDSRSCSITETVNLPATSNTLEVEFPINPVMIQLGEPLRLQATLISSDQDITNISWTSDTGLGCTNCDLVLELDNVFNGEDFTIAVEDTLGCVATASVRVIVEKNYDVYFPNIFSPNGDGTNDDFMMFGSDIVQEIQDFRIFDRWGGLVHEETGFPINDSEAAWDGKIDGQDAPTGVYIYMSQITFIDGQVLPFNGSVVLIR